MGAYGERHFAAPMDDAAHDSAPAAKDRYADVAKQPQTAGLPDRCADDSARSEQISRALPPIGDEAKPQGWSWPADEKVLDVPALDPQEALAFKIVEAHLKPLLPTAALNYLRPQFDNAKAVLDAAGNRVSKWPTKSGYCRRADAVAAQGQRESAIDNLSGAVARESVAVRYQPAGRKALTEYVVNLLSLVVRNRIVYLVCTMWDYRDVRQLALHRVRKAELLASARAASAASISIRTSRKENSASRKAVSPGSGVQ